MPFFEKLWRHIRQAFDEVSGRPPFKALIALLLLSGPALVLFHYDNQDILNNYVSELIAAAVLGFLGYYFRRDLMPFIDKFVKPVRLRTRLPLMIASAPIILGVERHVWREHGIDISFDWRYAGRDALDDLLKDDCDIAVASDYAVAKFMSTNFDYEIGILPFVHIQDHIQVVALEAETYDTVKQNRIAFFPNSVHEDFLAQVLNVNAEQRGHYPHVSSSIEAVGKILPLTKDPVEANSFVLWEPHYQAFKKIRGLKLVDIPGSKDYHWFLCVVAKRLYLEENKRVAKNILRAVRKSCSLCVDNSDDIMKACMKYFPQEFAGLSEDDLRTVFPASAKSPHSFGVDSNLKPYLDKLKSIETRHPEIASGMARLTDRFKKDDALWPGLEAIA